MHKSSKIFFKLKTKIPNQSLIIPTYVSTSREIFEALLACPKNLQYIKKFRELSQRFKGYQQIS